MKHEPKIVAARAVIFSAWRVTESGAAYPIDTDDAQTWQEAEDAAKLGGIQHKEGVFIKRSHPTGAELRVYSVKQKSQAIYQRCERTGDTKPFRPLYLAELYSLPVDSFLPTHPFDAFKDDATGLDRTMVTQ